MITTVPQALSAAIEAELRGVPAPDIREAAAALSLGYRGNTAIRRALSPLERAAYLAVRFPATFAAAGLVWRELVEAIPPAGIASVLDIGAGPGTASLASLGVLPVGTQYTWLERDAGWRDVAARLAHAGGIDPRIRNEAMSPGMHADPHDIVVASYALGELPAAARGATAHALWQAAAKALVVVEPGTPQGFETVRDVRTRILALGGHAVAPCTHSATCPMSDSDWCHRPVRVERSAAHRAAKQAHLGFEDEKFSYVVLARERSARDANGRIVRKPMRGKGHLHLDLCTDKGIQRLTVGRADRENYRSAREAEWGNAWPPQR